MADKDQKNGKAQTETERKEVTLRDVQKNARNVKYLIEGLQSAANESTAIKRAVNESKIVDLLKAEIVKMRALAEKIALKEFEV